ncbi:Predicted DNA-binding protein, contains Ribbon-helix-helix (RHH) domain [Faunimonas pinastri]|uniref:Predicted DNA-binding protein, contains Ribbon-helix-helix (RHH) domain n=1 Tax=Faunimonas pinastri TaxID=1855383 RepID=A0A1H9FPV1_9HYPH|nr:ribbon-helix-helix domain-containing protein [Faunimonas pinastri]SEQ39398.1 Predicted DNA-binding protein, contains Ribbon-helix-helix (RHH) domain [Faunimonas pinastri]
MKKRSVTLQGHSTSVSVEEPFWQELKRMAAAGNLSLSQLISGIDEARGTENLSSALRLAVLQDLKTRLETSALT